MRNIRTVLLMCLSTVLLVSGATNYQVVARYPVPGSGGFDYLTRSIKPGSFAILE